MPSRPTCSEPFWGETEAERTQRAGVLFSEFWTHNERSGCGGVSSPPLTPPAHPAFPASQQAKRLPPPAISLRSKSMTSELEEMGEPVGPAEGQGRPGARGWTTLDFVSVVSHEGSLSSSCPAPPPCPWARFRGLCVTGKSLRVSALPSCLSVSLSGVSGGLCVSFYRPLLSPPSPLLPAPPPTEEV